MALTTLDLQNIKRDLLTKKLPTLNDDDYRDIVSGNPPKSYNILKVAEMWVDTAKEDQYKKNLEDVSWDKLGEKAIAETFLAIGVVNSNGSPTEDKITDDWQRRKDLFLKSLRPSSWVAASAELGRPNFEDRKFLPPEAIKNIEEGIELTKASEAANKNVFGDKIGTEQIGNIAKQNRLSEQAALILLMEEILAKTGAGNRRFKNIIPIRYSNGNTPTGHQFITNSLTKPFGASKLFKELPPQVLSFLVPSIKMYKMFYKDKDTSFAWRVPFDNVPAAYKDQASEYAPEDLDKILSGESGFHSVGIKSFEYEYRGVNPAEIDTNIHATLELYFQNPQELVKEIVFGWDDERFVSKPKGAPANENLSFSYSDLINVSTRMIHDKKKESVFNEKYYRIKIECGYANVHQPTLKEVLLTAGKNEEETRQIIDAIISTKVALFLTPYQYNINFDEGGQVKLAIEFNAAMDTMLFSTEGDLFSITEEAKALENITKKYEEFLITVKSEKQKDKENANQIEKCPTNLEDQKKITQDFLDWKPELRKDYSDEKVLESLWGERTKAYNGIYDFLLGRENLHGVISNTPRTGDVDIDEPVDVLNPTVYIAKVKPDILNISDYSGKGGTQERIEQLSKTDQLISVSNICLETQTLVEASKAAKGEAMKTVDEKQIQASQINHGAQNIKFIFLGDILDIAFDVLNKMSPKNDIPLIVLGTVPIEIPVMEKIGPAVFNVGRLPIINPNLADIPISLNLFQEFMVKHIVEAKKDRYPVLQFFKDIISDLLVPAITPSVFGKKNAIWSPIRLSTSYFTLPTRDGINPIHHNAPVDKRHYFEPIDEEIASNLSKAKREGRFLNRNTEIDGEHFNYIFATCLTNFPYTTGDEEKDEENGIMRLRLGSETGIVKKINFEMVKIPFQRETLARREGSGKGTTLKQFYNANVEMFGNDLFRIGDYVFIYPNYVFSNKKTIFDLQEKLGVGGYYVILGVKTKINDMQYETQLKCSYQHSLSKGDHGEIKRASENDNSCEDE